MACLPGGMRMVHFVSSGIYTYRIRHVCPVGCLMVYFVPSGVCTYVIRMFARGDAYGARCLEWDIYIHDTACLPGGGMSMVWVLHNLS